ncbi:NAD(P)-binding protein [Synechococcus sp. MIT S1220]|uniref:NAD(P)-binding protein n=1 Tax=Synechococcus sp. MIT S1220 TaxID=3082549 RepID=UPI0039B0B49C
MRSVDLAVVGGGLAACSLVAQLQQRRFQGTIGLVEAGRGPGGRSSSRESRTAPGWRLDHGAPSFNLTEPPPDELRSLLNQMEREGYLIRDDQPIVGLNSAGRFTEAPQNAQLEGKRFRGQPSMASVCEGLLKMADPLLQTYYNKRICWLERDRNHWHLSTDDKAWTLAARRLVLSGNLLAHPRGKSLMRWDAIPLRAAVTKGFDPQLDDVLSCVSASSASIRWTCMIQLSNTQRPEITTNWPGQIWLDEGAQNRWPVERLVLQPQQNGGLGLVIHGLQESEPCITPEGGGSPAEARERMFLDALPGLLACMPRGESLLKEARSWGVMRWGAAQPLDNPLPSSLQWCSSSAIGFCGDWIDTPGFGRAEGALRSAVNLAGTLTANS